MADLLARLRRRSRLAYVRRRKPASLMVAGKRIGLDHARYAVEIVEDFAREWYEGSELDLIDRTRRDGRLVRGTRVMDIGAAIGLTAMTLADAVGDASIVAYEPDPATAEDCRANLAANGHSFPIRNAAMTSGDDATTAFNVRDAFVASSLYESAQARRTITVPAVNFARELARIQPQVIMMDVEGAEVDLLTSVTDFGPLHTICVELHPRIVGPERIEVMLRHLTALGFERQPEPYDAVALLYKTREHPTPVTAAPTTSAALCRRMSR